MPQHCTLLEPGICADQGRPFGLNENGVPLFECIRILAGSVDIKNKESGKITKNRFSYQLQSKVFFRKNTIRKIVLNMFDGDITVDEFKAVLERGSVDNREFWEELRSEICFCIVARHEGRFVEAFLYLYRILELVSIALPLVYASSEPDYRKSMQFLKELAKNERDSDLSVFKSFVISAEKTGGYERLSVDFPIPLSCSSQKSEIMRQLQSYVISSGPIKADPIAGDEGFSVRFSSVPLYIISIRNRLFHNSRSNDNFRMDPLRGAGGICEMIVDPGLYWFSLVLIEIVKVHARRYV